MHIFVKESLYLLDYNDNILDTLFISTDKRTAGYAYEINIQDHNTGYSDLTFRMPCDVITGEGEKIKNPKLNLIKPLSKVRYNRQITYMGKTPVDIPVGGDTTERFPKNEGKNPEDYIIEDYVMDYVIQPLDKSRQNIGIGLTYTAIDFPRFNLSKKKVGLTFNNKTIVNSDLSLFKNHPLSVPGKVQYLPWTMDLAKSYQSVGQVQYVSNLNSQNANPGDIYYVNENQGLYQKDNGGNWNKITGENNSLTSWAPNPQSGKYPLDENAIKKLVDQTHFSYGILSTIYYWPITESGRFEGVQYEKDGFITLSLYNTYEGSDWEGSDYLNSITWEWGSLEPMKHYLSPNNACNYLRYILQDTNWKVKGDKTNFIVNTTEQPWFNYGSLPQVGEDGQYIIAMEQNQEDLIAHVYRAKKGEWVEETDNTFGQIVNTNTTDPDFGTLYDVDIEQVEVSRTKEASIGAKVLTDARYDLKVDNSNCYNAITSGAKLFDLYPVFDCINKTVTLKLNVGKNYGLTYRFKSDLKNSNVKVDGEKVITKLYVTGGRDVQGSRNINIGEAARSVKGVSPILYTPQATSFDAQDLNNQIVPLEKNAYENLNGAPLKTGLDMSTQSFKLEIPDNLYELKYTQSQLEGSNTFTEDLCSFSSGKKVQLLYNPTGRDHCFYIYIYSGSNSYTNENTQLYKFDYSNRTLRRNLTTYQGENLGTISSINSGATTREGTPIVNYFKYKPTLIEPVYKEENFYKGSVKKEFNDNYYVLNADKNQEIVLAGPDRVYEIKPEEEKTYAFTVGNYYYRVKDKKYLYCVKSNTDTGSIYSKINTISINGYVFEDLGTDEKDVMIRLSPKPKHQLLPYPYALAEGNFFGAEVKVLPDGRINVNGQPSEDTAIFLDVEEASLGFNSRITLGADKCYMWLNTCYAEDGAVLNSPIICFMSLENVASFMYGEHVVDDNQGWSFGAAPTFIVPSQNSKVTRLTIFLKASVEYKNITIAPMLAEVISDDVVRYETYDKGSSLIYHTNGEPVKNKEWMSNNFALRVEYDGTKIQEKEGFNPNAPEYVVKRSPYGETYIYNFKYMYDNGWLTKEQILDIYKVNQQINDLNLGFYDRYTKDLVNTRAKLKDAINNQEIYSTKADAQLEALMSQYWVNPNKATDGQFSAFPGTPKFNSGSASSHYDNNKKMYWEDITYSENDGNGHITNVPVKRVYFNIFNSTGCNELYPHALDNKTTASNPEGEGQYHVVAKALGWDNNVNNVLTLDRALGHYTEAQDPSKTAESYNHFVEQMKEYYYRAMKAEQGIEEAKQELAALNKRYEEWEKVVKEKEKYLQENYGQYIIEGSYNNGDQPYANLLFEDGLEASDKYATPKITYNIGVVDASGLIEYRAPQLHLCNRLVKRLHSVGQIAPHVGDYVAVQDEPMGMFGVPGLITTISRRIDNPYQNQITVDTSYSDADELVGNIITATNTVLSNKDIYGRAAIINNRGELSSTSVNKALSSGKDAISIVSTSGKVSLDDNGLSCFNPHNNQQGMRYNGTGILASNDAGASWRELLNPNGINANYINAGTINSSKVSVTDGGHDITILNSEGLTVKTSPNKKYTIGSLNSDGVVDAFDNVAVFVGRDKNNNGVGYFSGYINASKGGNIGGWKIKSDRLTSGDGSRYVGLCTSGDYRLWAGSSNPASAPFSLKADGSAHFTELLIDGNSSIDGGSIQNGTIHNSHLADGTVEGNKIAAGTITAAKIANGTITAAELKDKTISGIKIGDNAIVARHIVANTITGDCIAANTITGSCIASNTITGDHIKANSITASQINADNLKVKSTNISGKLTASQIEVGQLSIGSGQVYGDFSANRIKGGTLSLTSGKYSCSVSGREILYKNGPSTFSIHGAEDESEVFLQLSGGAYLDFHYQDLRIYAPGRLILSDGDGSWSGLTGKISHLYRDSSGTKECYLGFNNGLLIAVGGTPDTGKLAGLNWLTW